MVEGFKALFRRVLHEPAVVLAVVVAAINTTIDQTWKGYLVSVGIALLRFVVSPVYGEPKPEPVPEPPAGP